MDTSSMMIHIVTTTGLGKLLRHCSARFSPDAMPSFAESDWISIAMRLLATMTQSS